MPHKEDPNAEKWNINNFKNLDEFVHIKAALVPGGPLVDRIAAVRGMITVPKAASNNPDFPGAKVSTKTNSPKPKLVF